MELLDYVAGIHSHRNLYPKSFPPELALPKELHRNLREMYEFGEQVGCEFGQSLIFDSTKQPKDQITYSKLVQGNDISCDPPRSDELREFADMHSHPSASIGHKHGFSAHSLEDWLVFKYHLVKPLFIRFVSSGDYVYALAYRSGLSTYNPGWIDHYMNKNQKWMTEYFERYNPKKDDDDDDGQVRDLDPYVEKAKVIQRKLNTPGFGKALMDHSVTNNWTLATTLNFGFYRSNRSRGMDILTLYGGPKGM